MASAKEIIDTDMSDSAEEADLEIADAGKDSDSETPGSGKLSDPETFNSIEDSDLKALIPAEELDTKVHDVVEDTVTTGEPRAKSRTKFKYGTRYKGILQVGEGQKLADAREKRKKNNRGNTANENKKRKLEDSKDPETPEQPPEDPEDGEVPGTRKNYRHYPERGEEPSRLFIRFDAAKEKGVFPPTRLYHELVLAANTPAQRSGASPNDQSKPGSNDLELLLKVFGSKGKQSKDDLATQAVKFEPIASSSLLTTRPAPESDQAAPKTRSTGKTSAGKTSTGKTSTGKTSIGKTSTGKASTGKPARKRKLSETASTPAAQNDDEEDAESDEEASKSEDESHDNKEAENNHLDDSSAPVSDINHIFSLITKHAVGEGLFKALGLFGRQGVRIVTMCSGTEAPFVALDLIRKSLSTSEQRNNFKYQHLGSAEIEPWKQAFILRNFSPPVIFRDVTDFSKHMTNPKEEEYYPVTAYGKRVKPPQGAHILVAGSSCVDYSSLNKLKGAWNGERGYGESAKTMNGIGAYAWMYKPTMIIIENVATAPWDQIKLFWKQKGYATVTVKLSTVDFYLPQTRQRGYLFGVHMKTAEKLEIDIKQALKEWIHLMAGFQCRASSPYTDFTLRDDDPRLQSLGDSAVDNKKKGGSTDWVQCRKRHVAERVKYKLGVGTPYTKRREHTQASLDDYANQTWALQQSKRVLDVLDIRQLDYVTRRDYDMRFKSRNINVSQNVDRDRDLRQWGIVGCVTPKGCLFDTRRGGRLSGLEVLALQGFPIGDLQLDKYTSGQLQDLAGNAMSTTVIGPAILSAIMACFRVAPGDGQEPIFERTMEQPHTLSDEGHLQEAKFDEALLNTDPNSVSLISLTTKLPKVSITDAGEYSLAEITEKAGSLQPLCRCEGLYRRTTGDVFYCPYCYYTCCNECSRDKHGHPSLTQLEISTANRPIAATFVQYLLEVLPAVLKTNNSTNTPPGFVSGLGAKIEKRVSEALGSLLHFQGIRFEGSWKAVYESEFALLELVFVPHHHVCEESCARHDKPQLHLDVVPVWLLFAKAPKNEPTKSTMRATFNHPIASMTPEKKLFSGMWKVWDGPDDTSKVIVKGTCVQVASWERGLGVEESHLATLNRFSKLKISHPSSISDNGEKAQQLLEQFEGEYELLANCPAPSGTLHRRVGGVKAQGPGFLFLHSEPRQNASLDRMVFSNQPYQLTAGGGSMAPAIFGEKWRPVATNDIAQGTEVECKAVGLWSDCPAQTLEIPLQENTLNKWVLKSKSNPIPDIGCVNALTTLLLLDLSNDQVARDRLNDSRELEIALERKPLALNDFGWVMSHAATVPDQNKWQDIDLDYAKCCTTCSPVQPLIKYVLKKTGKSETVKPLECSLAAATFENALENRPKPAIALLRDFSEKPLLDVKMNVKTLAHRAAAPFSNDLPRHSELESLQWRLNTYDQLTPQPVFSLPKLLSNETELVNKHLTDGTDLKRVLWPSQSQALAWMVEQETSQDPWHEISLVESCLPALGWRLEAKALLRRDEVHGGVIADDVGAGKTTTSLALVAYDRQRTSPEDDEIYGKLSTNATLILVPKNILLQWEKEVKDCLGWKQLAPNEKEDLGRKAPYFIVAKDMAQLQKYSREQIESAALVLAAWNIFGLAAYWTALRKIACSPCTPDDPGRAFEEWLSETLSHLDTCVEGWKNNTKEFWKAWDGVKTETTAQKKYDIFEGFLTRQIKRRLTAKKRAAMKAKQQDTEIDEDEAEGDAEAEENEAESGADSDEEEAESGAETDEEQPAADDDEIKQTAKAQLEKELKAFRPKEIATGKRKGQIKAPPVLLHMFAFRRVIVDEYTYVEGKTLLALLQLKAPRRWILSGTPPTHTYDNVNTMAKLIGTRIATYDEGEGKFGFGKDAAKMSKDKSHVQELQSYQNSVSAGFKEELYQHAKDFSERFIRKNYPTTERPKKEEEIRPVKLTPTEWITYLDVNQLALDPDRPFGKKKPSNKENTELEVPASIWKLADMVEMTGGPVEARICSGLMLQDVWPKQKTKNQQTLATLEDLRLNQMIQEQEENIRYRISQLVPVLQELWYMQGLLSANQVEWGASFSSFVANVSRGVAADLTAVAIVERLLFFTKERETVPEELLSKSKKKEKSPWKESAMSKEDPATKEFDLRMARVENHFEILMHGLRRLRLVTAVANAPYNLDANCHRCPTPLDGANASISIFCGHTLCRQCVGKPCCRSGGATNAAPASRFSKGDLGGVPSTIPCSRIRVAVALVKEAVEAKKSVLVFAQFKGMKDAFVEACKGTVECHDGFLAAERAVETFRAASGAACLVLKVDSADAAGWNLQGASTVVFLSGPVFGSAAEREAAMRQAVGRSWRPGQTESVSVYQLVASNTNEPAW
ncbi:hypothetical protein H2200_008165 [Cladophialophora chaetospira]|uniref:Helicase ATP-binding domain-containing protein n=1 Tax=Cladophialophora chaetospira TaxID=386627 RepID=A0AA38X593_9EURO|nr:hypothetical protein H2200_008165 [Cladophialophora chaetospira]